MKSKWLPPRDFGPATWQTFWNHVSNNANHSRKEEIFDETKDLDWIYLGDGKPDVKKILSGITVDNYTFPMEYDQDLMRKTIQGNHRHTNKVQIWIAVKKPDKTGTLTKNEMTAMLKQEGTFLPRTQGFFKVIHDPANQEHNLSLHNTNANVQWNLGFDTYEQAPMAINYK